MKAAELFTPIRHGLIYDMTEHFYPSSSYGCCLDKISFENRTNHYFGYVLSGTATLEANSSLQTVQLQEKSYFSVPGPITLEADGKAIVFERYGYRGLPMIGGPLEPLGRLSYIDKCTTSLIVPPARMTDPCLNQLVFPPHILQTLHTHPTIRLGLVYEGYGLCHLPENQTIELKPGVAFCLPAHQAHCFESRDETLGVIAFHPDTDTGPTDGSHPMLNRTYISTK